MMRLAKIAGPLAIAGALCFAAAPAKAQFGMDENTMQQFAPMLEMMKQKMGKRRFAQLMQTMGPMMMQMQGQGGFGGGFGGGGFDGGGFGGGGIPMMGGGGFDMSQMMGMMGSMKGLMGGGGRKGKRRHRG
jgi:hypothetical protein